MIPPSRYQLALCASATRTSDVSVLPDTRPVRSRYGLRRQRIVRTSNVERREAVSTANLVPLHRSVRPRGRIEIEFLDLAVPQASSISLSAETSTVNRRLRESLRQVPVAGTT